MGARNQEGLYFGWLRLFGFKAQVSTRARAGEKDLVFVHVSFLMVGIDW